MTAYRPTYLSVSAVQLYVRCPAQYTPAMVKYERRVDDMARAGGTVERMCEQCGTMFRTYPSRIGRKRYCSRRCLGVGEAARKAIPLAERLAAGLAQNPANGCLEWSGARDEKGYGRIGLNGRPVQTHRVAWTLAHGPITTDEWVLHHCDNPPCCRLNHLFLGTPDDNSKDMVQKGRSMVGERNGASKLTWEKVREIRARWRPYKLSKRQLAEEYGVSLFVIECVLNGKTWKEPG